MCIYVLYISFFVDLHSEALCFVYVPFVCIYVKHNASVNKMCYMNKLTLQHVMM